MKELEELTAEIREKLPRLMELEAGCKFTRKDEFGIIYQNVILHVGGGGQIADTGDYDDAYYDIYSDREGIETTTDLESEIEEIVGKDPMLNDVIQFLWKLVEEESENSDDIIFAIGQLTNAYDNNCWNFNKTFLKDQPLSLIIFLHGLINP